MNTQIDELVRSESVIQAATQPNRHRAANTVLLIVAAAMAVGLSVGPEPAAAQAYASEPVSQTASRTVSLGDLDLTRERDAKRALARIRRAAAYVCSGGFEVWLPVMSTSPSFRACVGQSSSQAVAALDSPQLAALYNARSSIKVADASLPN